MPFLTQKPYFDYLPPKRFLCDDKPTYEKPSQSTNKRNICKKLPQKLLSTFQKQPKQIQGFSQLVKPKNDANLYLPKLEPGQNALLEDIIFRNQQNKPRDRSQTMPRKILKPQKSPKINPKKAQPQKPRVSIQIPLQSIKRELEVEEKHYRHSDKNFQYDMKIVIKKVIHDQKTPSEHPLKKYLLKNGDYDMFA